MTAPVSPWQVCVCDGWCVMCHSGPARVMSHHLISLVTRASSDHCDAARSRGLSMCLQPAHTHLTQGTMLNNTKYVLDVPSNNIFIRIDDAQCLEIFPICGLLLRAPARSLWPLIWPEIMFVWRMTDQSRGLFTNSPFQHHNPSFAIVSLSSQIGCFLW